MVKIDIEIDLPSFEKEVDDHTFGGTEDIPCGEYSARWVAVDTYRQFWRCLFHASRHRCE